MKCLNRQEFVIGGWMASDKPGRELRSLLLGYYQRGKLIFAGKAGTGFGLAAGREFAERLRQIERDTAPFAAVARAYQRDARWVDPRLVAEVASPRGPPTISCVTQASGPPQGQGAEGRQA